jgi:hypothetical protein
MGVTTRISGVKALIFTTPSCPVSPVLPAAVRYRRCKSTVGLAGALAYTLHLRLGDDTGGEPGKMGSKDGQIGWEEMMNAPSRPGRRSGHHEI